ncbi:MAG: hypothetical protein GX846_11880 [Deltaproteobacteria bacterium]|nr:hypothetical protein [Deltaproteobacteria bacterium]
MITGINALSKNDDPAATKVKSEDKLGRDSFLKMFIAQLSNQDPLNPMDISQMSSQLAQYSSLEQLLNINSNLESIEGIQDSASRYQTLGLIGKEVQADSSVLILDNGKAAKGSFVLDEAAQCTVQILDDRGILVRNINLGILSPGNNEFKWDGFDNDGDILTTGQFTYNVIAIAGNGKTTLVNKYITGTVTGINLNEEDPVIYVNSIPLSMSQILSVNMAEETES